MQIDDYHRQRNHGIRTREHYRAIMRRFGDTPLSSETIAAYRDTRIAAGVAADTVRGEVGKLIALARWQGIVPVVAVPRKIRRAPLAWTRHELWRLFRAARRTQRTVYGLPGNIYWPALLGLAYDTGERIGALWRIEWSDIDLRARTVRYRAEIRKGGYADALGTMSRQTATALAMLRRVAPSRPFAHGCDATLWRAFGRVLQDAGLPSDRRSKFHRLRRTHATLIHALGGDATAALGHASDATTRRHYLDPRAQKKPRLPSPWGWLSWLW